MRNQKKGSLQLSINAIVVLILAITILGLGLGFIQKQWGGVEKQLDTATAKMKKQLVDEMTKTGELVVFDRIDIDAQRGVEDAIYLGISNTDGDPKCFRIEFRCIKPRDAGNECDPDSGTVSDVGVGGYNNEIMTPWFKTFDEVDIEGHQMEVYPIDYQIASIGSGTYMMKLIIYKGDDLCDSAGAFSVHQSKNFYLNVK